MSNDDSYINYSFPSEELTGILRLHIISMASGVGQDEAVVLASPRHILSGLHNRGSQRPPISHGCCHPNACCWPEELGLDWRYIIISGNGGIPVDQLPDLIPDALLFGNCTV